MPLQFVNSASGLPNEEVLLCAGLDCRNGHSDMFAHDSVDNWNILAFHVVDDNLPDFGARVSVPEKEKVTSLKCWLHGTRQNHDDG